MKIIALLLLLAALPVYAQYSGAINLSTVTPVTPVTGMYGYTISPNTACNTSAECYGYYCFPDMDGISVGNSTSNSTGWCNNSAITDCYYNGVAYPKYSFYCLTNTTYRKCSERTWESSVSTCSSGVCVTGQTSCYVANSSSGSNTGLGTGTNVTLKEIKTFSTAANTANVLSFTMITSPGITVIELRTNVPKINAAISLASASKPSGASDILTSSQGSIYSYASITEENITDSEISSAKIKFRVPSVWISTNGIDYTKVYMYRYSNGWSRLDTTFKSNDSSYYFYETVTPGFSTFAIAGFKIGASTTTAAAGMPSLSIVSPTVGMRIVGTSVNLQLSASGVTLANPRPSLVAGEGHFHVLLDNSSEQEGPQTTFTYTNVSEGNHTITVELRTSNRGSFDPPVVATTSFAVSLNPVTSNAAASAPIEFGDFTVMAIVAVVLVVAGVLGYFLFVRKKGAMTGILDRLHKLREMPKKGGGTSGKHFDVPKINLHMGDILSGIPRLTPRINWPRTERPSDSPAKGYEYRGETNYQSYHPDVVEDSAKDELMK